MKMLEDCINEIDNKISLCSDIDKELYKSIYYHLCDYKDILNKVIDLNNEKVINKKKKEHILC